MLHNNLMFFTFQILTSWKGYGKVSKDLNPPKCIILPLVQRGNSEELIQNQIMLALSGWTCGRYFMEQPQCLREL